MQQKTIVTLGSMISLIGLVGFQSSPVRADSVLAAQSNIVITAVANIHPTSTALASQLDPNGRVTFSQMPNGELMVDARITGLKPNSENGFHIHATADCSGDGSNAGGHFNPDHNPHNHPAEKKRHAGAMLNLKVDASGVGSLHQTLDTVTLKPGKYSIIGLPVIIHRDPDDYHSQPVGNAGPRIACGLIKLAD